jgi:signal peptidase I
MLDIKSIISKWFRSPKIREWWSLIIFAFLLFAGRSAIADWNRIPSGSMEPSIYIGDLVLVNKLAYDLKVPFTTTHIAEWAEPKRGEIVVFYKPGDNMRLIKRVIGTPGDVIEMKNNQLIINGQMTRYERTSTSLNYKLPNEERDLAVIVRELLPEKTHTVMGLPSQSALRSFGPIEVPAGEFLMLGDNRDSSGDSRYFGLVPRKQIIGRAERVLVSWDREDYYKPRFERFLQNLI